MAGPTYEHPLVGFNTTEEVKQFGSDLVPKDYPEPYKTRWDKLQEWKKWEANYPFSVDNVREFEIFCEQSGGFSIH